MLEGGWVVGQSRAIAEQNYKISTFFVCLV